jgi:hypothetical protein
MSMKISKFNFYVPSDVSTNQYFRDYFNNEIRYSFVPNDLLVLLCLYKRERGWTDGVFLHLKTCAVFYRKTTERRPSLEFCGLKIIDISEV